MRRTLVTAVTWFLSLCSSGAFFFTAGESTADTSVPWVAVPADTAAAPAARVTPIYAGDTSAVSRTTDTIAAIPLRQLNRRDSLLGSILATLDSAGGRESPLPVARVKHGIPERVSHRVHSGVSAAFTEGAGLFRRYRVAALAGAAGCGLILACWIIFDRRRAKKDAKRFMTTTRLSLMDGEVQRACLHIEKQYMDPSLTPASVCGSIVTGQPFLETMFERELGMSVAAYIDQVRIHHARQIVQWNPEAEATFIAEHTGYSNAAEFVKQWSRVTGGDFYAYRSEKQHSSGGSA